jgi:uncharacterized protein YcfL
MFERGIHCLNRPFATPRTKEVPVFYVKKSKEIIMTDMKPSGNLKTLGLLLLGLLAAFAMTGCKGKESSQASIQAPAIEKPAVPSDEITMDSVAAILGRAGADQSGIFAFNKSGEELQVTYHFYRLHQRRMEPFIGPDLAPKIQALYKKFPSIDRVFFRVDAFIRTDDIQWKPYCTFVTTRKLMQETNWTNLLAKDFFEVVLELKYAE